MMKIHPSIYIKILILLLFFVCVIILLARNLSISPLYDYCAGLKVNRKIIYRIFPQATFKIGSFVYDVDKARDDQDLKRDMEDFKDSIRAGVSPGSEDYWAHPYCIGKQYWLE